MSKYINKKQFYEEILISFNKYKNSILRIDDINVKDTLCIVNRIPNSNIPTYLKYSQQYSQQHLKLATKLLIDWLNKTLYDNYEKGEITFNEYISQKYENIKSILANLELIKGDVNNIISNSNIKEVDKLIILTANNHHIFNTELGKQCKKEYNKNKKLKVFDRQLKNTALTQTSIIYFKKLVKHILRKLTYTDPMDREECESGALLDLLYYWTGFDFTRRKDPFSYYTSIVFMGAAKEFNRLKINQNKLRISISTNSDDDNSIYTI